MNFNDFIIVVKYKFLLKVIVFNNVEFGFVKIEMEEVGLKFELEVFYEINIDFVEYVKFCGGDGIWLIYVSELDYVLILVKNLEKFFVIDVVVFSGELVFFFYIFWK